MSRPHVPPHVPPSVPGEGCDRFSQAAILRVDRELGRAESAALDAHLAACPACRLKAAQAEALSTVLKDWDARAVSDGRGGGGGRAQAPARLRLAIRHAAIEQGRWRRREVRLIRRVRLATAASILLVLGAGLFLGLLSLGGGTAPFEPAPFESGAFESEAVVVADHDGPQPAYAPFDVPAFAPVAPQPSRLLDVELGEPQVAWLTPAERARATRHLQYSEIMTLQRQAFEARSGQKAVWTRDPSTGDLGLITFAQHRGYRSDTAGSYRPAPASHPGESTTVVDRDPPRDTGRRIGHLLRLPGRRAEMERIVNGPVRATLGTRQGGKIGEVVFLPRPRGGTGWHGRVIDLVRASRDGMLVLRETDDADLVAITKGLRWPVFVPAGELIRGGHVDRVVLEGVWIQPNEEQVPHTIRCAPAGTSGASHGDQPEATGLMAGPKLRRFLATGPHPDAVRAWIGEFVPIQDEQGRDFSLLAWYSQDDQAGHLKKLLEPLLRADARGFVVTDVAGNLVSVETSELPIETAAPLLVRIVNGYLIEAGMTWMHARLRGKSGTPAARTGGREASLALLDLMSAETTFRHRKMGGTGVRVLRMTEPKTRTVVDAVERLPQGTSVLTSAFAP